MDDELKIIKDGVTYTLPTGWALSDSGTYSFNNKLQDRAFSHGSDMVGDGKASGRTVTVEIDLDSETEAEHDALVNDAYKYFNQVNYTLIAGRADRLYKIAGISKIKHQFEKGFKQRWSNVVVSLLLADPFRYATVETTISNIYAEAQIASEITFNNPSSVDVPLIFKFTPNVAMAALTMLHVESGQSFTMQDTLLSRPAASTVNADTGTVRRDAANSINTFSGIFLHALPGNNTFKFTGAAGRVDIIYTARWFV
jgi:Phage tail protein.